MIRLSNPSWGLAAVLLAAIGAYGAPSVDISMKAAFPSTPYLLELLETAAGENASAFFPLLDHIADGYFDSTTTEKDLYDKFVDLLRAESYIPSEEAISTFKLSLSLRSASPRIEAHYQYYATGAEPHLGAEPRGACDVWALFEGRQYCSPSLDAPNLEAVGFSQTKLLPFDRVLGAGEPVILYADIQSPEFAPFHKSLARRAKNGEISYRLRYRSLQDRAAAEALPVSGYGVHLNLKRTDYIVIDDREADADPAQHPMGGDIVLDEEEVADLKPLSKLELGPLGLNAASFVMQSENPLDTLVKLTQDFPKFSSSLAAHEASPEFIAEQTKNLNGMIPLGVSGLWMNGVQLIERQIEPFNLVGMLRKERQLIAGIRALGLSGEEAVTLLGHADITAVKSSDEDVRFDWRDETEEGRVIIWLNDLENDARYGDFPKSNMALLQRTYPGQIPSLGKDLFNLVFPVDFTNLEDLSLVLKMWTYVEKLISIRFGFVPLLSSPESHHQAKVVYYLLQSYGVETMVTYITLLVEAGKSNADKSSFDTAVAAGKLDEGAVHLSFEDVVASADLETQVGLAKSWGSRLGVNSLPPPLFVNGLAIPRGEDWMQEMSAKITVDLQQVQQAVFTGAIEEDAWIPGFFIGEAVKRRNVVIFPEAGKPLRVLNMNKVYGEHNSLFHQIPVLEHDSQSGKEHWAVATVVLDLSIDSGREILASALRFRQANPGVRLEIIHNPALGDKAPFPTSVLSSALSEVQTAEEIQTVLAGLDSEENETFRPILSSFLADAQIDPATNVILLNGRVAGPIPADVGFSEDDFQQLLEIEQTSRILPVYRAVEDLKLGNILTDPVAVAKFTSITALSSISDLPEGIFESAPTLRTSIFNTWASKHSAIEVGNRKTASIQLVALLNPASEQGQRLAPVLNVLSKLDGVYVKIFLNPKDKLEELPVKRFYRFVLDSEPRFDDSGKIRPLSAEFKGLPSEALLTAAMDVPPAWLVAPKVSVHDLDNIKLSSVKSNVEAVYELQNILIEGHSRLVGKGLPIRGAQLVLGTEKTPHTSDTIIMANLGFFQFKANPGFYSIRLKEGRTSEVFDIQSIGALGWSPVAGDEETDVVVMDFQGATVYPRLTRKPGMEEADVLKEEEEKKPGSLVAKGIKFAEGLWGSSKKATQTTKDVEEQAEINIFSVASGHLYERMLNIMMVSVMRNTKHTVKFWFIEQFLSPSFKDFIPHLAKEYGFKYEMITYKWPHWLRQQKEKQREIWGYKILFLDVLFPLSLDKVIFVDADQIVRTDMIELVNYDLEGAPYGFTPMCDSRTEMEGFRFWKQGYWANYLRGNPYHISALFVIDLRRFRELASGDRLRQSYHSLSADPGSLANLDQDLPNHMQFQIPIKSLPQEWLWCETWCSDESLSSARTIDLCNNPLTKEPKLDRARRQVPEWTVYDDEIAALDRKRKGLPAEAKEDSPDKVVERNTKSRKMEMEMPSAAHDKDEL